MRKLLNVAIASGLLAACQSSGVSPSAPATSGPSAYPPVCTVPAVKSGAAVTSIAAFGSIEKSAFVLAQPSSWVQVRWFKFPPPAARSKPAAARPRAAGAYYLYYGTYAVSDGTKGCLYVVTSIDGKPIDKAGNAALTGQPRIPSRGATLPVDFGIVNSLALGVKPDGTGTGSVRLVHANGSRALTGKLTIVGRIDSRDKL